MCPSDPFVGQAQNNNSYSACYGATSSNCYNWTDGSGGSFAYSGEAGKDSNGMFTIGKSYGLQAVTDGSSNTVAYAEALVGDSNGTEFAGNTTNPSHYRGNYITGTVSTSVGLALDNIQSPVNSAAIFAQLAACALAFQVPAPTAPNAIQDDRGFRWCMGTTGWSMFNTIQVPNDSKYVNGGCRGGGTPGQFPNDGFSYPASSQHPGGANVLFGDGSCRFIKSTISYQTWWSLGTRNGGEVISSDSY
jgi:prepilin-type processing-associated H-X9-DG protein